MPYYKNEETMTSHALGGGQLSPSSSSPRPTPWIISRGPWGRPSHMARVVEKFCVPLGRMAGHGKPTSFFSYPYMGSLLLGNTQGPSVKLGKTFRMV